MTNEPSTGNVIEDFVLKRQIGKGSLGTIWEAIESETDRRYAIKLYPNDKNSDIIKNYSDYLWKIKELLEGQDISGVLLPIAIGETEDFTYQVYDFIEQSTLADLIALSGPMHPRKALSILKNLAFALAALHEQSIIHVDIKPSNILLPDISQDTAFLVDFGMAYPIGVADKVLFVSTFNYMHPDLIETVKQNMPKGGIQKEFHSGLIGPYIDIYALGVVALEMLTGSPDHPVLITESEIATILKKKNPWIKDNIQGRSDRLANLIFQMLSVSSDRIGISANTACALFQSLITDFQSTESSIQPRPISSKETDKFNYAVSEYNVLNAKTVFVEVLQKLKYLDQEIADATRIYLAEEGTLTSIPNVNSDEEILLDVNITFQNALNRIQSTWKLGVVMTIISFSIIILMITSAVILSLITKNSQWALIFGGASVPVIIGTLLWRPYDRVFRATILAQQIEMIHVRTIAGFRGTFEVEKRMEICSEAISSLETLLRAHATSGKMEN